MAGYVACPGSGQPARDAHRLAPGLGSKCFGKSIGFCPECDRAIGPTKDGRTPRHKHYGDLPAYRK